MIEKLFIRNYLIIKKSEINFSKGLNILTGETGAGKSIILDALSLILGDRADYSIIRDTKEKLVVEGLFRFSENKNVTDFLESNELSPEEDNETVIVRRELYKKGNSRNFINDIPVNISILKKFGEIIIDIHSQNEHQSLLNKETHLEITDEFLQDISIFEEYSEKYTEYKKLVNFYKETIKKREELLEKRSFLEFQLKEINNVNPLPNEDEDIEKILNRLENTEEISISLKTSIGEISENEKNILTCMNIAIKEIKKISKYDTLFENEIKELENSVISVKEVLRNLESYLNNINFEPEQIEKYRERISNLQFLKKKYRMTVNELIKKSEEIKNELEKLEKFDFEIEKILNSINENKKILFKTAYNLSEQRKKQSEKFEKNVKKYFKEVGLENADFKISIEYNKTKGDEFFTEDKNNILLSNKGIDEIEFLVITNKGEEFQPLKKIASGGEISRIMLSIKAALSNKDRIPILVFDEIDSGISGRIAEKVGKVLKKLSESHQLISITHLPQIAAFSENHLSVSKSVINKETVAEIKKLSIEEKVIEVAKLISGETITESSIKTAKELISNSNQTKTLF